MERWPASKRAVTATVSIWAAARWRVSYLLEANEAQAGEAELPADRDKIKEILVTKKPPKG